MVLKDYSIDIFGLKNSKYNYQFYFDNKFFELFENSPIEKGKGSVELTLHKSYTFIKLDFYINGNIELICDRSLDKFLFPLDLENSMILKFGEENKELTDEIEMIPWESQSINVAQFIYEFIGLAVPMKKLHPRYEKEDEWHGDMIFTTRDENQEEKKEKTEIDPRWNVLKDLKNKRKK